jgi:hypothetical protein
VKELIGLLPQRVAGGEPTIVGQPPLAVDLVDEQASLLDQRKTLVGGRG